MIAFQYSFFSFLHTRRLTFLMPRRFLAHIHDSVHFLGLYRLVLYLRAPLPCTMIPRQYLFPLLVEYYYIITSRYLFLRSLPSN